MRMRYWKRAPKKSSVLPIKSSGPDVSTRARIDLKSTQKIEAVTGSCDGFFLW